MRIQLISAVALVRGAIVLALAALTAACADRPDVSPAASPPPLASMVVASGGGSGGLAWDGVVQAVNQASLSAQTSGRVSLLAVDVNDRVGKGAILLRLTAVEQGAVVTTARAQLQATEAQFAEADARFKRVADLIERQLVSRDEFERVRAARDTASAARAAASAQLAQTEQQLEYTVVRAPYAGIVSERHVEVGETVAPGQPLLTLYAPGELRVEVQVPESTAAAVRAAPGAAMTLADGRRVAAAKVVVFPAADAATHSVTVRLALPKLDSSPQPGQAIKVVFPGVRAGAGIWLPAAAVIQRGELSAAYVIHDNAVVLRQLRLGRSSAAEREVVAGLQPGETVATDALAALQYVTGHRATTGAGRE